MATIKKIKLGTTTYDIRDASVPSQIAALDGTATIASVDASTSEISIRDQVVETDGIISTSSTVVCKTYTSDKINALDKNILDSAKGFARDLIVGLGTVMKFMGTVANETALKAIKGAKKGEVYVVTADGSEWVATADASSETATTTWEKFGTTDVANPLYKDDTAFVSGYLLKADGTAGKVKAVPANGAAVGLGKVTNDKQVKGLASGTTSGNIVIWGADGYTVADGGVLGTAAHSSADAFDKSGAAEAVATNLKSYIDGISIVSGGGHTHGAGTLSGSCTPNLIPTKKHITASASGAAVTLGTTQYISAIDATKSYLSKGTIAANTFATGISVAASTSSANTDLFHASYDSTNECLDLSPMKVSAVKSHSAISYANGSLQATDSGLAQVCTGLGTPTKSAPKVASVTNPTITLSNTATTGGVELLESVSGDTTTVTISGETATGGSHSHGVSFAK